MTKEMQFKYRLLYSRKLRQTDIKHLNIDIVIQHLALEGDKEQMNNKNIPGQTIQSMGSGG